MAEEIEIFDVVNEFDVVIGTARREEVHKKEMMHRSVHLLVFNGRDEVLLQKRSLGKDTYPGTWDSSVSGHVNSGEEYDQCVIRESSEEMGIELGRVPERMFKIEACEKTGHEFSQIYRYYSEGPFFPNENEISEIKWFSEEELAASQLDNSKVFSPAFSLIWSILTSDSTRRSSKQP